MAEESSPPPADVPPGAPAPSSSVPPLDDRPSFSKLPDLTVEENRHERSEAKRLARETEQQAREAEKDRAAQKKSTVFWIVLGVIVLLLGGIIVKAIVSYEPPFTRGFIHWHARVQMDLCGVRTNLPCLKQTSGQVHGESFCGTPDLHHHYDNIIHMEGTFQKPEDMSFGKFLDGIGLPFSQTQLWNWTNGMTCQNATVPGKVSFEVNGKPNPAWGAYAPRDGDVIRIAFG